MPENTPESKPRPNSNPVFPDECCAEASRLVIYVARPARDRAIVAGQDHEDEMTAMHVKQTHADMQRAEKLLDTVIHHADIVRILTALMKLSESPAEQGRFRRRYDEAVGFMHASLDELRKLVANVERHAKLAEDGDDPIVIVHKVRP
jgi:hypothetical protein